VSGSGQFNRVKALPRESGTGFGVITSAIFSIDIEGKRLKIILSY
jgi:hypothetical protein